MSAVELFVLIVPRDLTDGYGLYFREAGIRDGEVVNRISAPSLTAFFMASSAEALLPQFS